MTSPGSESAFEQTTYDAVISKTFTRITECPPTRRSVDTLRKEVEHVLVNISVPNFSWSEKYGLLAEIKPEAEYTTITGGLVYVAVDEDEPSLTHPRIRRTNSKYRKKNAQPLGVRIVPHGTQEKVEWTQSHSTSAKLFLLLIMSN